MKGLGAAVRGSPGVYRTSAVERFFQTGQTFSTQQGDSVQPDAGTRNQKPGTLVILADYVVRNV
jgi:hypothetical protein